MPAALKMTVGEVTKDTEVEFTNMRMSDGTYTVVVHAVGPILNDGPWLGSLRAIPANEWPEWAVKKYREGRLGPTKLWAFYPVTRTGYDLFRRPAGMAFGKMGAALALRDYIAIRNQG